VGTFHTFLVRRLWGMTRGPKDAMETRRRSEVWERIIRRHEKRASSMRDRQREYKLLWADARGAICSAMPAGEWIAGQASAGHFQWFIRHWDPTTMRPLEVLTCAGGKRFDIVEQVKASRDSWVSTARRRAALAHRGAPVYRVRYAGE